MKINKSLVKKGNGKIKKDIQDVSLNLASITNGTLNTFIKSPNMLNKSLIELNKRLSGTVNTTTISNYTQSWGASYGVIPLINVEIGKTPITVYSNKQLSGMYFFDTNGVLRASITGTLENGKYKYTYSSGYDILYIAGEFQTSVVTDITDWFITLDSSITEYSEYGSQELLETEQIITSQMYNVFAGRECGENTFESQNSDKGRYNTAFGVRALQSNVGGHHLTAFGYQALMKNTTGTYNTAFGEDALFNTTTGESNTAIGIRPMQNNTTGGRNVAVGGSALYGNTTGSYNTVVGTSAGQAITTEEGNVIVGYNSNINAGVSNAIVLGRSATGTKSNAALIGNATTEVVDTYGDFESLTNGGGIRIKSPNGTLYKISVNDAGNVIATAI